LKASADARIVNLSVYGLVALPGQAAYGARKFAMRGFSIALGHELRETRIGVTVVHPGGVATAIADYDWHGSRCPRPRHSSMRRSRESEP